MTEEEEEMYSKLFYGNNLLYEYAMRRVQNANNTSSPLILQKFLSVISLDQTYYFENNIKLMLSYHDQDELYIKCFKELLSSLHSLNKENFFLASKLFVKEGYQVQDDFQRIANDFKYGIESVDFSKKEDLTEFINAHIEDKIRNVVQDLLPNNNLDVDTRLGLVDLAHFKGKWDKPFELEPNTRIFYLNENDSVETQMLKMTGEVYYDYDENRSTTTIELPLTSEEYSIVLCMADREHIKEFGTNPYYYLPQNTENMTLETVEVFLPKFKIETLLDCKKMFADMHLAQEFNDNVYLFDVLQNDQFLKYAQIDEKGIISIDEEGVEATSGLAVTMVPVDLDKKVISPDGLNMSEMTVKTTISNRFAKTLITCKIRNNNDFPQETNFSGVLPETAFITEFIMEIDGKSYKSYIKPVEEAKAIYKEVTKLNSKHDRVPIFSLSFGSGADKAFLRELSLRNFGFSRHIYEASDASLQLQSFYKQISSPLLTDIKFKYESDVTELTRTHFPIYFRGGELVVSGRYGGCQLRNTINGCGLRGYLNLESIIENPVTSLERLWAYLTVKQLLDERSLADDKEELTKRAVDLAMKYCFVTEVTSLVVVKPDEICDTSAPPIEETQMEMGCIKKKCIKKRCIKKRKDYAYVEALEEPESVAESEAVEEPEPEPEGPKKLEFLADRPFLMAIMLKRGDRKIILFVGEVHKPL